ncbi:cytochrome-c peroxidase [Aquimonas sp.]|jgi:cytochrome c peroxidase|uniref:cytochrome-c peroxidase n=1 Tax=Aquimonas sp. TaxID=1872588 RepID=UPI0037BFF18D
MNTYSPRRRQRLRAFASSLGLCLFAALISPVALVETAHAAREGECDINPFPDKNPGPGSLRRIRPIEPPDLSTYVVNRSMAIALGKALFWDMQVGSDGVQSCASCHFRAGADPRSVNQIATGGLDNAQTTFELAGPNHALQPSDFPLHSLADPNDRFSQLLRSVDDVVSSQGMKLNRFEGAERGASADRGSPLADAVYQVHGANVRRVEPRNTPTVINAAFARRSFWDGRADQVFNGVNEHGARDADARVVRADLPHAPQFVQVRIEPGAMASQAVAPVGSDFEMSFRGRRFLDAGRRLASATPLAKQKVAWDDSVLVGLTSSTPFQQRPGLNLRYETLVKAAFHPRWWNSNRIVHVAGDGSRSLRAHPGRPLRSDEYSLIEYNFSLFFGLAIQLYENTLISDDAPIDRYFEGQHSALTAAQLRGLALFTSQTAPAACSACHAGAEFTNASLRILLGAEGEPGEIVERMLNGECETVVYDQSFYNIGVRPTWEDLGLGARDPFGNPLSVSELLTMDPAQVASPELLGQAYPNIANPPLARGERTSTMGAFKVPSLRNIELTAPYFHNGGELSLHDAVRFYNRGGNFREANVQFIDFEIGALGLSEAQVDDLVAFMKALTDERVRRRSAPFDHPQLFVPDGALRYPDGRVVREADGSARDRMREIPAVGRQGGAVLPGFLEGI